MVGGRFPASFSSQFGGLERCKGASASLYQVEFCGGGKNRCAFFSCFYAGFPEVVGGRPVCGLLGAVSCPRSLQGLGMRRLPRMYGRLERSVVGRLYYGPKRFTTDLKAIRLAMTLRCICGAPCSHVI